MALLSSSCRAIAEASTSVTRINSNALRAAVSASRSAQSWHSRSISTREDAKLSERAAQRTAPTAFSRKVDLPRSFSTSNVYSNDRKSADVRETEAAMAEAPFEVFTTVADFRQWRQTAMKEGKTVGFVPTMGALHEGHMDLVRQSLAETDMTVVSIFVNPAQFAPTEDLASYPRTLQQDMAKLAALESSSGGRGIAALFAPNVKEMYPSPDGRPFTQHVDQQTGAFVEVHGLQSQMEGASRPTFFRGVATVCTKLFHIIQPDLAFFGQKDIQQCIILRRLVSDLLFPHPPSAEAVRILPTTRDQNDGLALSSRNAYLTPQSRRHAPALYQALQKAEAAAKEAFRAKTPAGEAIAAILDAARSHMQKAAATAQKDGVLMNTLYITLNDKTTLANLEEGDTGKEAGRTLQDVAPTGAILSGAVMVREGQDGRATRLIDNILLEYEGQ